MVLRRIAILSGIAVAGARLTLARPRSPNRPRRAAAKRARRSRLPAATRPRRIRALATVRRLRLDPRRMALGRQTLVVATRHVGRRSAERGVCPPRPRSEKRRKTLLCAGNVARTSRGRRCPHLPKKSGALHRAPSSTRRARPNRRAPTSIPTQATPSPQTKLQPKQESRLPRPKPFRTKAERQTFSALR